MGNCPNDLRSSFDIDRTRLGTLYSSSRGRHKRFALDSLGKSLIKKFVPTDTRLPDQEAITLFRAMNARCEGFDPEPFVRKHAKFVEYARGIFDQLFWEGCESLFPETVVDAMDFRYGPGATQLTRATSLPEKIGACPLSFASSYALALYKHTTTLSETSQVAESHRQKTFGTIRVEGSVTLAVPKTASISRLVCIEPLADMYCQLGLGKLIERFLKKIFGISLKTQPEVNKELARIGSLLGLWATVDLKSASDTIALKLCEVLMTPHAFQVFMSLSCRKTRLPDGSSLDLHMMSTMGNGFTFPLQTLIFTLFATFYNGTSHVFGDDIVLKNDSSLPRTIEALEDAGFIVNRDKSFWSGSFRESCGGDFFEGVDVRGVYIKSLCVQEDFFLAYNLIAKWCIKHDIVLQETLSYLLRGARSFGACHYIPHFEADNAGLKFSDIPALRFRKELGAWSIRYTLSVPKPPFLSFKRYLKLGGSEEGWLLGGLLGCDSSGVHSRMRKDKYTVKVRYTPSWECAPPGPLGHYLAMLVAELTQ